MERVLTISDFTVRADGVRRAPCKHCDGRGWMKPKASTNFPDPCPACGGCQAFSRGQIIKATGLIRSTLDRYLMGEEGMRAKTIERVEHKLRAGGFIT